ncbi:helix-turn-helix transcriptional regulator [Streptomyces sp. NBC_01803]|uniref:helix-turn-helix transcriptional regulator n=1 Tax=Streptomyces sp. NBC_01803 TaxID=2975946 RepID=UPI002DD8621B|nr:AraC family transcriptional regulator [Streptomyces sp. NBC_01803]WSA46440.1 AraC family transcriptional regulator [Streptomyces sp. NBC_01803]
MNALRDHAEWRRIALGPGDRPLDLMTARFDRHRYAPHAHEEFAIGACTAGLESIRYRGADHLAGPGTVVILQPGEAHTGGPADACGMAYRVLYPMPDLVAEGVRSRPWFPDPVVYDPELAAALTRLHRDAEDGLRTESALLCLFADLARRWAGARPADPAPGCHTIARAVRTRLADEPRTPPTLAEIAAGLGLSRWQVLRAFRAAEGMPPYAWLAQYRVTRARGLLDAGHRPAEAAALVGFADQAHLTRWFRRVLGVTPGAYRNSVQDAPLRPG